MVLDRELVRGGAVQGIEKRCSATPGGWSDVLEA